METYFLFQKIYILRSSRYIHSQGTVLNPPSAATLETGITVLLPCQLEIERQQAQVLEAVGRWQMRQIVAAAMAG